MRIKNQKIIHISKTLIDLLMQISLTKRSMESGITEEEEEVERKGDSLQSSCRGTSQAGLESHWEYDSPPMLHQIGGIRLETEDVF